MLLPESSTVGLVMTIFYLQFPLGLEASDPSISSQLNLVRDLLVEDEGHSDNKNPILPAILDPFGLLKESSGIREVITSEYSANSNEFLSDQSPIALIMEDGLINFMKMAKDFITGGSDEEKEESEDDEHSRLLQSNNIFDVLLDIMQANAHSVGLLSLSILVHLAEMITFSLASEQTSGVNEDAVKNNIIHFINTSKDQLSEGAEKLHDPKLPQNLIDKLIKETGTSTSCLQLLFCKTSPFIWALQNGVKRLSKQEAENETSVLKAMLQFLPDAADYLKFSKDCEAEFNSCLY